MFGFTNLKSNRKKCKITLLPPQTQSMHNFMQKKEIGINQSTDFIQPTSGIELYLEQEYITIL